MDDLEQLIDFVAAHRTATQDARPFPGAADSLAFAATEGAEYIDALLRVNPTYLRNNAKAPDAKRELAQTGYMIASAIVRLQGGDEARPDARMVQMAGVLSTIATAMRALSDGKPAIAYNYATTALAQWCMLAARLGHDPAGLLAAEAAAINVKYLAQEPTA